MKLAADHPMQLVAGLACWSLWFVAVYGAMSVACAVAPPAPEAGVHNPVSAALLAFSVATVVVLAAGAWACARAARRLPPAATARRFVAAASAALYAVAAIATAVVALPLLALPPCV